MVRFKNRYLVGSLVLPESSKAALRAKKARVTGYTVFKAVMESIEANFGAVAVARNPSSSLAVRNFDPNTQRFLLRCPRKEAKMVQAAVTLITQLADRGCSAPCAIDVLHVGGTIKKCEQFLLELELQSLARVRLSEQEGGVGERKQHSSSSSSSSSVQSAKKRKLKIIM
jgi:RNase P/RNase MRP subunit POP5